MNLQPGSDKLSLEQRLKPEVTTRSKKTLLTSRDNNKNGIKMVCLIYTQVKLSRNVLYCFLAGSSEFLVSLIYTDIQDLSLSI